MGSILLLEDDDSLNRGISLKLEKEGYEVISTRSVAEAETAFSGNKIDLIISDITVEDGSGLEFCRKVRKDSSVFILFLTALDQEVDIVNGYDCGADDYMTKPFSLMVLISKVNAFMRRAGSAIDAGTILVSDDIELNSMEMKVYKGGTEVMLSKKELQLLSYFMEYPQHIISREQILYAVWDIDGQFVDDNTVPVTISRLKRKLTDKDETEYLKNVRGIGYLWTKSVWKKS